MNRNTRKANNRNRVTNACTMEGLEHWYTSKFEKLGWMLLAKAMGHDTKIAEYKRGISRLLDSIQQAMGEYNDPDRIRDLRILHTNTTVLHDFVNANM